MLKPIVDGFVYNIAYRPLCEQFDPVALAQMEALRRAKTYRPYWIAVPSDVINTVIPARGSFEYQAPVPYGSWLWGFSIALPFNTDTPATFVVQATEICSGLQLFSEYVIADVYGNRVGGFAGINLLSKPMVIQDPGIAVELYNTSIYDTGADRGYIQVLLLFDAPIEPLCKPEVNQCRS